MTEEEFLTEFVALRDQFPRGSKLVKRGRLGWRYPSGKIFVHLDGTLEIVGLLERCEPAVNADGCRTHRYVRLTPEEMRTDVLKLIHGEFKFARAAIARGAATRTRRREAQLNKVLDVWLQGRGAIYANRDTCACCKKLLTDPESRTRGVGPECWEFLKQAIEQAQAKETEAA